MRNRLSPILCIVTLFTFGCADEFDDFDDFDDTDEFRPEHPICPECAIKSPEDPDPPKAHLGISTDYNPAWITNVRIQISNSGGTELLDYGTKYAVPNDPDEVEIADSNLCTVNSTGNPPTAAYVQFQITNALGIFTIGENIPVEWTANCP